MMVPALALALGACGKKEEPKAPEAPVTATEAPVQAPPPAPPVQTAPGLSAEERAAKLGFVKHLPQDTEVVMSFHNGSKAAERVKSSKLWKLIQSEMGMGMMGEGQDFDPAGEEMDEDFALPEAEQDADATAAADEEMEEAAMDEPMGPAALFGTEFTIALGKSTGDQTANLLTLNRRSTYFQMRALAKAFAESAKTGDFSLMEESLENTYGPEFVKDLANDPESGVALFEKMYMPPLYLAFRTSDAGRESAAQEIAALTENLAMFGEMIEPVEVEKAGRKFSGHRVSGAKISASMAEERAEMEEMLDPAVVDRLLAAVAKKDLVVVSGTIGNYVVLFLGSSIDELNFAADVDHSLAAGDSLAFSDAYASKELAAVIYGDDQMLDKIATSAGGLAEIAGALRDGLAGSEGLGDTRDLEALLRMVGERETALRKLSSHDAVGMVAFFEDGLKIESFGGTDSGMIDWKTPNKLASLGASQDVVMFANYTTVPAYDDEARAYIEALMETAYAITMKISEFPIEDGDMAQFKEITKMFDTTFRTDAVAVWDALSSDFSGSLGLERALVVDLKGAVPAIPGIPQKVVDEGNFPRVSMVAPVTDRAKLSASWEKINTSLTSILAKVSKMAGEDIPMQKPISSEKNGYTTWFFSMPFFNDDFMPSVTVGDQWSAASTSKNQALDLLNQAAAGGETEAGATFTVNFKALEKFSEQTIQMLEKNAEALDISESDLQDAAKVVKALEDLDTLTVSARRENGTLRSSLHLKTR
jgi:hypothetical protein